MRGQGRGFRFILFPADSKIVAYDTYLKHKPLLGRRRPQNISHLPLPNPFNILQKQRFFYFHLLYSSWKLSMFLAHTSKGKPLVKNVIVFLSASSPYIEQSQLSVYINRMFATPGVFSGITLTYHTIICAKTVLSP